MARLLLRLIEVFLAGLVLLAAPLLADEGMYTYDAPPLRQLHERHGFAPSPEWLERLRLASVRFMDGGSGAFVSSDGLILTNHHVGLQCIQNLSAPGRDYVTQGFYAPTRAEEAACPGYEVNVLVAIEDVGARVRGAVRSEMSDAQAAEARRAAIAAIESACHAASGRRCDVVTLYQGAEFHLYAYEVHTDVRLVFAPEQQAAMFGGDPDNFTFPRHDLDIAFFRAYRDGRPVRPAAFLPWSREGAREGELLFVSGHPGSTHRLHTLAQLEAERDRIQPLAIADREARLAALRAYSARGDGQRREALADVYGYENSLKARRGRLVALRDAAALARLAERERELRERVAADPELARLAGDAWEAIARAQQHAAGRAPELEYVGFAGSRLLEHAATIVRYVEETAKPNGERLEEYVDANLASLRNELYSPAPISAGLEEATLAAQLEQARRELGADHAFVEAALAGRSPEETARAAIVGTRLFDPAARRALVEGGPRALAASQDPMLALARRIDPLAREVRRFQEQVVDAVVTRTGERIARARFAVYGKTQPPDATFTLRLGFGVVKGYPAEGTEVQPFTTLYGLVDRALGFGNREPWRLAPRFAAARGRLALETPLNFVTTHDTIGGHSGSPVVDRDGAFVGVVFDGNIHSLAWDYYYTDERARTVCVDARGIAETLRGVYGAEALLAELVAGR